MSQLGRAAAFLRTSQVNDGRFGESLRSSLKTETTGAEKQVAPPLPTAENGAAGKEGSKDAPPSVDTTVAKDQVQLERVEAHKDATGNMPQLKRVVEHGDQAKGDTDKNAATVGEDADSVQTVPMTVQPLLAPVADMPAVTLVADEKKAVAQKPEMVGTKAAGSGRGAAASKPADKAAHASGGASGAASVEAPIVAGQVALEPKTVAVDHRVQHANTGIAAVDGGRAGSVAAKTVAGSESAAAAAGVPASSDLKTLVATPNVLEIGVASGQHGWVRVRAELDPAGAVATSLVAASSSAAEGLHKELPALSAYLAGEQVGFSSLVVNAADKGAGAQDAASHSGGEMQQGQKQEDGRSAGQFEGFSLPFEMDGSGMAGSLLPGAMLAAGSGFGTGNWLSVRV